MALIAGTLNNASGVRPNTKIILTAYKTTSDVVTLAPDATIVTSATGAYSFECKPSFYNVRIQQPGYPCENVGIIQVYSDSVDGTINDFLTTFKPDDLTPEILKQCIAAMEGAEAAQKAAEAAASTAAEETAQKVGLMYPVNAGNWSTVAGSQLTEVDRYKAWSYPDNSSDRYAVRGNVTLPITIPVAPDTNWYLASSVNLTEMRTDSASQLGGVYKKDYATGDVIPVDAMKNKLMYWHNGQFYSIGTDAGFTSNDFDADLEAGRFVSAELTTQMQQWRTALDARGWGLMPEYGAPTINQTSAIIEIIAHIKANKVTIRPSDGNYLVDGDALDFRDCTVGGFVGSGIDKVTFWADTDNTTTPFFNLGSVGSPVTPTDSDIQYGSFGGFSLRANGKNITTAVSMNFYRRGGGSDIRSYGFGVSFSYDYMWLNTFDSYRSANHTSIGHEFGGASLNALTFTGLEASSTTPYVKDYLFKNPNTVLLISPDSEGSGGGFYFEDGRSVTLLNLHCEAENTKLRNTKTSINGLGITLIGGASFNSPQFIKMPFKFNSLTLTGFSLFDVGDDFNNVAWEINARHVVINNLNVTNNNKISATRGQVRQWVINSLGVDCEFCSLDGEVLRCNSVTGVGGVVDKYLKPITPTPGTPIDIKTSASIERAAAKVWVTQRLSSSAIASVEFLCVVTDSNVITSKILSEINNDIAGITIGYNAVTNRFTVDSSVAAAVKIIIESIRA